MKKINIAENNIALFDISGGGFNSLKLVSRILPEKKIMGFYWLIVGDEAQRAHLDVHSYQTSFNVLFSNYNLLEFLITAPEFPIAYLDKDETIIHTFNNYEKKRIEAYKEIYKSEILFSKDLLNTFKNIPVDFDCTTLIELCNIFCNELSIRDYWNFKDIYHGTDEAHSIYVPLLSFKKLFK